MRANATLFWILAGFFFLASAIYTFWHIMSTSDLLPINERIEWVGTVALGLTGMLGLLIAFYLTRVDRATGGVLPEDRLDADIDDGDAEQGFFSPWSWWPMFLGFGVALVFLGLAVGVWVSLIGGPIAVVALVGWIYEYYRGYFAR